MFHRGHLELFAHMAAMGKNLFAAIHDDKSVYINKKVRVTDSIQKRMDNVSKLKKVRKVFPVYTRLPVIISLLSVFLIVVFLFRFCSGSYTCNPGDA
jgi:bifunctional ADP-heptose synthase (sugar kinase/adenylyltransferase)